MSVWSIVVLLVVVVGVIVRCLLVCCLFFFELCVFVGVVLVRSSDLMYLLGDRVVVAVAVCWLFVVFVRVFDGWLVIRCFLYSACF